MECSLLPPAKNLKIENRMQKNIQTKQKNFFNENEPESESKKRKDVNIGVCAIHNIKP
jgi:macrodomain Ter protein organizer (MatP/YcbG family)